MLTTSSLLEMEREKGKREKKEREERERPEGTVAITEAGKKDNTVC